MDEPGILDRLREAGGEPQRAEAALLALERSVAASAPQVRVFGCHGSFVAHVAAQLAATNRPLVLLTADEDRAASLLQDVAFFLERRSPGSHPQLADDPLAPPRVLQLPAIEHSPY